MDDHKQAVNLALIRIDGAVRNLRDSTGVPDAWQAVRQLRQIAEDLEDELMELKLADVPRFAPPH